MSAADLRHENDPGDGPGDEQMTDALIARALWGCQGVSEFEMNLELPADADPDGFEWAVAAAASALAEPEPLPEDLRRSLRAAGRGFVAARAVDQVTVQDDVTGSPRLGLAGTELTSRRTGAMAWAGWMAAAASLVFAFVVTRPASIVTPAERLAALESAGGEITRATWAGLSAIGAPDHALDRGVSGGVVWSDERDEGYMRISGIEANDPGEYQYQLWIFDATRPTGDLPGFASEGLPEILTQRPVDGGVFDVVIEDGEIVVPIEAKLPIGEGVLFAVTKERPGGVVVSDREIVFLALKG